MLKISVLLLLLFSSPLLADELTVDPAPWPICPSPPPAPLVPLEENIIVDLKDPIYEEGVLSTRSGGVLATANIRMQAQNITYNRDVEVYCEGNLLVDYKRWALVGESLFYDFVSGQGVLTEGRTAEPPWYIGGREIWLMPDGTIVVRDGFITTSEGEVEDVVLRAAEITLSPARILTASHVTIKVSEIPIFWLPTLQLNLKNISRSPFAVKYGWGGFRGSYVSLLYRFLSWRELQATARLDAFFGKGFGGGIETVYNPSYRPTQFYTRNYYAQDLPLNTPRRRDRYRFQGTYYDCFYGVAVNGKYDFVSDAPMAADYQTKDFDLKTAGRTEIDFRKKEKTWIAHLLARVRVNRFQTVNQDLPTLEWHLHPFQLPYTGIIWENAFRFSYLHYVFSDRIREHKPDFSSGRLSVHPVLYRPFLVGPLTAIPEAGFIGIAYSNSPGGGSAGQALGQFGVKLETAISRCFETFKHIAEPYIHYHFLTSPRVKTDRHFIFTIEDGLDRLNQLRFGLRHSFFNRAPLRRTLWIDLWANAFIATHTIKKTIPRGYLNVEWQPHPRLLATLDGGWNFQHHLLDFCNIRFDWTVNEYLAHAIEYRYRGRFYWRKSDFFNFILESVRSEEELLRSPLSDRRNTFLFRTFARLSPDWSLEINLRHGWHRRFQHPYLEYEIEVARIIYQHWRLLFNYEKREADHRFSFAILLNPGPPHQRL